MLKYPLLTLLLKLGVNLPNFVHTRNMYLIYSLDNLSTRPRVVI